MSKAIQPLDLSTVSATQWSALNVSVGGRLFADGAPFARACFNLHDQQEGSHGADPESCASLQAGYLSEQYRVSHFGSSMSVSFF